MSSGISRKTTEALVYSRSFAIYLAHWTGRRDNNMRLMGMRWW